MEGGFLFMRKSKKQLLRTSAEWNVHPAYGRRISKGKGYSRADIKRGRIFSFI